MAHGQQFSTIKKSPRHSRGLLVLPLSGLPEVPQVLADHMLIPARKPVALGDVEVLPMRGGTESLERRGAFIHNQQEACVGSVAVVVGGDIIPEREDLNSWDIRMDFPVIVADIAHGGKDRHHLDFGCTVIAHEPAQHWSTAHLFCRWFKAYRKDHLSLR